MNLDLIDKQKIQIEMQKEVDMPPQSHTELGKGQSSQTNSKKTLSNESSFPNDLISQSKVSVPSLQKSGSKRQQNSSKNPSQSLQTNTIVVPVYLRGYLTELVSVSAKEKNIKARFTFNLSIPNRLPTSLFDRLKKEKSDSKLTEKGLMSFIKKNISLQCGNQQIDIINHGEGIQKKNNNNEGSNSKVESYEDDQAYNESFFTLNQKKRSTDQYLTWVIQGVFDCDYKLDNKFFPCMTINSGLNISIHDQNYHSINIKYEFMYFKNNKMGIKHFDFKFDQKEHQTFGIYSLDLHSCKSSLIFNEVVDPAKTKEQKVPMKPDQSKINQNRSNKEAIQHIIQQPDQSKINQNRSNKEGIQLQLKLAPKQTENKLTQKKPIDKKQAENKKVKNKLAQIKEWQLNGSYQKEPSLKEAEFRFNVVSFNLPLVMRYEIPMWTLCFASFMLYFTPPNNIANIFVNIILITISEISLLSRYRMSSFRTDYPCMYQISLISCIVASLLLLISSTDNFQGLNPQQRIKPTDTTQNGHTNYFYVAVSICGTIMFLNLSILIYVFFKVKNLKHNSSLDRNHRTCHIWNKKIFKIMFKEYKDLTQKQKVK